MPTTKYRLYNDDCRIVCTKLLQANSIDSVICDPPYGLKFMGKEWDHGVPGIPFWTRIMRVCKSLMKLWVQIRLLVGGKDENQELRMIRNKVISRLQNRE